MKNFSLSLYAFHLRHSLTDAPGQVDKNASILWENLKELGECYPLFSMLKDFQKKIISYKNNKYEPKSEEGRQTEWLSDDGELDVGSLEITEGFTAFLDLVRCVFKVINQGKQDLDVPQLLRKSYKIKATLQPFLVNDTYIADLTLKTEPRDISIDIPQLQHFKPSCLLPSKIQASLGQTLWIYREVDSSAKCDELANKFAIALVAGTNFNPVKINQGKFLGSLLFEYQAIDPNDRNNHTKQCQILIVINNSLSPTIKLAENAYDSLRNLLLSYHKILYTKHNLVYQRYQKGKEIYSYLENKIQTFNNITNCSTQIQLSELKKILVEITPKTEGATK